MPYRAQRHVLRFPPRNRIIAGLSAAVVVVEAARTGGALITAVKGAEYGIAVFAMPGNVDRGSSEGRMGTYWSNPTLPAQPISPRRPNRPWPHA